MTLTAEEHSQTTTLTAEVQSQNFKAQGNQYFKAGQLDEAISAYTQGIGLFETAILYANRAAVHLKKGSFRLAFLDAEKAILFDPEYTKAFYRRGCAYLGMLEFENGLKDFKMVVASHPSDPFARKKLTQCRSLLKKLRMREMLVHDSNPFLEKEAFFTESIPKGYDRYVLPTITEIPNMTWEDVMEMVDAFENPSNKLHWSQLRPLLRACYNILKEENTVVRVSCDEAVVFGDTHGQFFDLAAVLRRGEECTPERPFIFLGDYVDRGDHSTEILAVLMVLKVRNPSSIIILRGNHESSQLSSMFGFQGEVEAKYSDSLIPLFTHLFFAMPLCAVVNDTYFCVHGGLPVTTTDMSDLESIDRFHEVPSDGPFAQLMWADPSKTVERGPSERGPGFSVFGKGIIDSFLADNDLEYVIRAHQVFQEGHEWFHDKLLSIFSAPNYMGSQNNAACVAIVSKGRPVIETFSSINHPKSSHLSYVNNFSQGFMGR
ncbi:hypothetical protein PCE1_000791 [Barthelona sp. PCE]